MPAKLRKATALRVGAEGRANLDVGVDDDVADDMLAGRQLLRLPPPQGAQVQRQTYNNS